MAIFCALSLWAGPSLHASENETLLQKMKRLEAEAAQETPSLPAPLSVSPSVSPPASPSLSPARPAPEDNLIIIKERPSAPTRPARPLHWPPDEADIELDRGDEGSGEGKDFHKLRVPLGEAGIPSHDEFPARKLRKPRYTYASASSPLTDTKPLPRYGRQPDKAEEAVQDTPRPAAGYLLGPGDRLKIVVFGEEDLSGDFTVNDSGEISYPLIGEVDVRNLTLAEAKGRLAARLRDGYLRDPRIAIEIAEFRPFYITGEVRAPGSYSFVADMSVMNAVVMAGGFTFRAEQDEVKILRNTATGKQVLKDIETSAKVQPGDIIVVEERFF